ncbi:WLM-domain-containing protein [Clavulina sp. PMI_390]|nr:WLM-domain-containing protein [Clavulina sp. PMI_390]
MVHTRINEKVDSPNPYVNFISALPTSGAVSSHEDSIKLLRALAAQVKPVMKAHGFVVNSLEEARRNWNAGETIELVLRREDGRFWPVAHLLSVFCHELAHIKHMHHLPSFHKLRIQLQNEVLALQQKGYFGDGMYSAGHRLADSMIVPPEGVTQEALPDYVCGGAQPKSRSQAFSNGKRRRRIITRRPRTDPTPSLHTGAQTKKKLKAGGRVTSKFAFGGEDAQSKGHAVGGEGAGGFRKSAKSKTAREQRAVAAERRLHQLQTQVQAQGGSPISASSSRPPVSSMSETINGLADGFTNEDEEGSEPESEDDNGLLEETDMERRQRIFQDQNEIGEDGEQESLFDFGFTKTMSTKATSVSHGSASTSSLLPVPSTSVAKSTSSGLKSSVHHEIASRKQEALGLDSMRILGGSASRNANATRQREPEQMLKVRAMEDFLDSAPKLAKGVSDLASGGDSCSTTKVGGEEWICSTCTLINHVDYAICSVCGTRQCD